MFCFYDNGTSFTTVADDYVTTDGQVVFAERPSVAELSAAFPGYAAAANVISIQAQIIALEATQTPRRLREALAGGAGATWLDNLETQIAALRAQLPPGV